MIQPTLRKTDHWEHQCDAYGFALFQPATMLAMDMGTGKSLVCLSIIANELHKLTLILCPKSVLGVWRREIAKHYPLPSRTLILDDRSDTKKKAALLAQFMEGHRSEVGEPASFVVTNYESAWRAPLSISLMRQPWDCVVLDESHRCKSPGGKASRYVHALGQKSPQPRRFCLTGTPMPHSPLDAYAQYRFLDPSIFGTSFARFRARYAICNPMFPSQVRRWINQDEFQEKFGSIAYRCKASEVLTLPEVMHDTREIVLTPKAMRVYDSLRDELIADVDSGVVVAGNALVKLLRLQQITSGYVADQEGVVNELCTAKKSALLDLLEDIDSPTVVFCRFQRDLDAVQECTTRLGRCYGELSGRRRDLTELATMPDGVDVMAVQIQAGGVGVDLTRASYGVYYSIGFSLGDFLQSQARLHRPGQKESVRFYHLVAAGTVDEQVYAALENREEVVESVLRGLKNVRSKVSSSGR